MCWCYSNNTLFTENNNGRLHKNIIMKLIKTVDAEGAVLCHDITQIIKGVTKDAVFRKGHVVTKEDIPVLLSVGKDQLYVWEKEEGMLHENDGAEILCAMCKGEHMERSQAKEGKIELTAACDGLLKVDNKGLKAVNGFGQMMIATRHGNFAVKKGDKLAGTRIIPLVIEEEKMTKAKEAAMAATGNKPILNLLPFKHKKVGIVTTGNEVFYGRIDVYKRQVYAWILKLLVRSSSILLCLIPFFLMGSLIFTPVFVDIGRFVPSIGWIGRLFLPYYFLL